MTIDDVLNKIYEEYQRVLNEASDMFLGEYCGDEEDEEERYKEDEECLKYMKELLKTVKEKMKNNNTL